MPLVGKVAVTRKEREREKQEWRELRKGQMTNGIQEDRKCLLTLHLNLW